MIAPLSKKDQGLSEMYPNFIRLKIRKHVHYALAYRYLLHVREGVGRS